MAYLIALVAFAFAMFPFTQLYPLETYNQPYAIAVSALFLLIAPLSLLAIPRNDRIGLIYLALCGAIGFLIEVPRGIDDRELLYLLTYITPLIIIPPLFYVMRNRPAMARRFLVIGILIWVMVGAIQRFIDISFLNFLVTENDDLSENIVASGRGVLGFAPEPTHHGLHLVLMATALLLLNGNRVIAGIAIAAAALLAGSSFALLALAIGTFIWAASAPLKRSWFFFAGIFALLLSTFLPYFLSGGSRFVVLVDRLLYSGLDVFVVDASANARISGIFLPIWEVIRSGLMPTGLSWQAWLDMRTVILVENGWVFGLSGSGAASGFGVIFIQLGFFSLPILGLFIKRFFFDFAHLQVGLFTASAFFCFMGQFYIATPTFAIVYAAMLWSLMQRHRSTQALNFASRTQRVPLSPEVQPAG